MSDEKEHTPTLIRFNAKVDTFISWHKMFKIQTRVEKFGYASMCLDIPYPPALALNATNGARIQREADQKLWTRQSDTLKAAYITTCQLDSKLMDVIRSLDETATAPEMFTALSSSAVLTNRAAKVLAEFDLMKTKKLRSESYSQFTNRVKRRILETAALGVELPADKRISILVHGIREASPALYHSLIMDQALTFYQIADLIISYDSTDQLSRQADTQISMIDRDDYEIDESGDVQMIGTGTGSDDWTDRTGGRGSRGRGRRNNRGGRGRRGSRGRSVYTASETKSADVSKEDQETDAKSSDWWRQKVGDSTYTGCGNCGALTHYARDCPRNPSSKAGRGRSSVKMFGPLDFICNVSAFVPAGSIGIDSAITSPDVFVNHASFLDSTSIQHHDPIVFGTAKNDASVLACAISGSIGVWSNVRCIPELRNNLCSVLALTNRGYSFFQTMAACFVINMATLEVECIGTIQGNLPCISLVDFGKIIHLDNFYGGSEFPFKSSPTYESNSIISEITIAQVRSTSSHTALHRAHLVLGHINKGTIVKMYRRKTLEDMNLGRSDLLAKTLRNEVMCEACANAKIQRNTFKLKPAADEIIGDDGLCYANVKVLYSDPSYTGVVACLVVLAYNSKYPFEFGMTSQNSSEVARAFIDIIDQQMPRVGFKAHIMKMDSASYFKSAEVQATLIDRNVLPQFTSPGTPEQNGPVEVMFRILFWNSLAMLLFSGLPAIFGYDAFKYAVIVFRVVATKTLWGWMSPYEALTGKTPSMRFLHIFGCMCYSLKQARELVKGFVSKAWRGFYLRPDAMSMGVCVWIPDTVSTIVTANYTVDENVPTHDETYRLAILRAVPSDMIPVPKSSSIPASIPLQSGMDGYKFLVGGYFVEPDNGILFKVDRVAIERKLIVVYVSPVQSGPRKARQEPAPYHVNSVCEMMFDWLGQQPHGNRLNDRIFSVLEDGLTTGLWQREPKVDAATTSLGRVVSNIADDGNNNASYDDVDDALSQESDTHIHVLMSLYQDGLRCRPSSAPRCDTVDVDNDSGSPQCGDAKIDNLRCGLFSAPRCDTVDGKIELHQCDSCELLLTQEQIADRWTESSLFESKTNMFSNSDEASPDSLFDVGVNPSIQFLQTGGAPTLTPRLVTSAVSLQVCAQAAAWYGPDEHTVDAPTQFSRSRIREINALVMKGVFELCLIPATAFVYGCFFVDKVKSATVSMIGKELEKSRLVILGNYQRVGIDVFETYAPVVRTVTLKLFFAICLNRTLTVYHVDVDNAFAYAPLSETIFMWGWPGSYLPSGHCLRLRYSLYGLRNAPLNWYKLCTGWLLTFGFTASQWDPCLFFMRTDTAFFILAVYVDDFFYASDDESLRLKFEREFGERFSIKLLGPLTTFLGVNYVLRSDGLGFSLNQNKYVSETLELFQDWTQTEKRIQYKTPLPTDALQMLHEGRDIPGPKHYPFQNIIGTLLWLVMMTRIDITLAVNVLSRYSSAPTSVSCYLLSYLLRYLAEHPIYQLDYARMPLEILGFSDSDFGGDLKTRHSRSGIIAFICGGPLHWKSKLQSVVASSVCEAEFIAEYLYVTFLIPARGILKEAGVSVVSSPLFMDSKCAIDISKSTVLNTRTLHQGVRIAWLRMHCQKLSTFHCIHVISALNLADGFTKLQDGVKHAFSADGWSGANGNGFSDLNYEQLVRRVDGLIADTEEQKDQKRSRRNEEKISKRDLEKYVSFQSAR